MTNEQATGQHTPEPWMRNGKTVQGWARIDGSGERVGLEFLANPCAITPSTEDARRIVACVNACAGLSTEKLAEGVGILAEFLPQWIDES